MLVVLFSVVKVESIPLNSDFFLIEHMIEQ